MQEQEEVTVVFLPGPVGLQLEVDATWGSRVVRFVDGGPWQPGPARASGAIQPGDWITRVELVLPVGEHHQQQATTYNEMLQLLQKAHLTRKLTVRSFAKSFNTLSISSSAESKGELLDTIPSRNENENRHQTSFDEQKHPIVRQKAEKEYADDIDATATSSGDVDTGEGTTGGQVENEVDIARDGTVALPLHLSILEWSHSPSRLPANSLRWITLPRQRTFEKRRATHRFFGTEPNKGAANYHWELDPFQSSFLISQSKTTAAFQDIMVPLPSHSTAVSNGSIRKSVPVFGTHLPKAHSVCLEERVIDEILQQQQQQQTSSSLTTWHHGEGLFELGDGTPMDRRWWYFAMFWNDRGDSAESTFSGQIKLSSRSVHGTWKNQAFPWGLERGYSDDGLQIDAKQTNLLQIFRRDTNQHVEELWKEGDSTQVSKDPKSTSSPPLGSSSLAPDDVTPTENVPGPLEPKGNFRANRMVERGNFSELPFQTRSPLPRLQLHLLPMHFFKRPKQNINFPWHGSELTSSSSKNGNTQTLHSILSNLLPRIRRFRKEASHQRIIAKFCPMKGTVCQMIVVKERSYRYPLLQGMKIR